MSITFSITIAINGVNKCNPATLQWNTAHNWTVEKLFAHLTKGFCIAVGIFSGNPPNRRKADFISSQVIGLDFDDLSPELSRALLANPFTQKFCAFTYSTASHTQNNPRLRLFFILDKPISSSQSYESAVRRVMHYYQLFAPDIACKDAARFFYGNNATDPAYTRLIGKVLPVEQLKRLPDPSIARNVSPVSSSELPEDFINDLTRSIQFTGRKRGEFLECHCPIHPPDKSPSAYWHPDKKILHCFHESRHYLAKEVGEAVGIRLSDYSNVVNQNIVHFTHPDLPENTRPLSIDEKFPRLDAQVIAEFVNQNEYGDARLLMFLTSNRLIYDHSERAWYWWHGHRWAIDTLRRTMSLLFVPVGESYSYAAVEIGTQAAKLEAQGKADENHLQQLETVRRELEKRPKALRTYNRSKNVLNIAMTLNSLSGNEWDKNALQLCVQNGVVDLRTGELLPGVTSDYNRKVANVAYHPHATCSRWDQFINEICNGDETVALFIQRMFGYFITGLITDHVLPVFYGHGRNGKDTLVETIGYVLGDYASTGSGDLLIEQTHFSGQAQPHIFNLLGKRLVWVTETSEGSKLNVNQVKYLTGTGRLIARPLYGNPIEFDTTHHIVLFTNHKPRVPSESEDYAIWKRLLLIPLVLSFVDNPTLEHERLRDPELKQKLITEAPGILTWLVKGCIEWQRQGLNPPEVIRNATNAYAQSEDIIGLFLEEACELHPSLETSAGELNSAYNDWAIQNGYPLIGTRKLAERLAKQFDKKRLARHIVYVGLALK